MPAPGQRVAGALLAVVSAAALTAQSPAPQSHPHPVPHPHPSGYGYGHGPGYGPNGLRPQVYVNGIIVVPAAAPAKTPQAKPTKRPPGAEDVFETHSTTDAQ